MGNMSGDYGSHYTLWQSITQNYQHDIYTNVTVKMYLTFDGSSYYAYTNSSTSGTMTIDGATHNYSIPSINFSSGQAKDLLLAEWTGDIKHNETSGEKQLTVSGSWNTNTTRIGSGTSSSSLNLTPIARYVNITHFSVSNLSGADGLTKVQFNWGVDAEVDFAWYSNDGGNNWEWLATNSIVNALQPNTSYNFRLRVRRKDSQLITDSNIVTMSTYDIGRLSSVPNINFGDTATIMKSNPSGAQNNLRVETLNPTTTVVTRLQIPNNYDLTLTDEEWDAFYKKLGKNNSMTIRYVIDTFDGSNTFYHWEDRTLTLKGNQKTIYKGTKRGKVFVGTKRGVTWQNVNGTWKRGG